MLKDSEPPAVIEPANTPSQPSSTTHSEPPINSDSLKDSTTQPKDLPELTKRLSSADDSAEKNGAHWSKLKKAAISKDVVDGGSLTSKDIPAIVEEKSEATIARRSGLTLTRKTKHYR